MRGVGPAPYARIRRHEQLATPSDRQRRGAWYTPEPLARQLSSRLVAHCRFGSDGLPVGSIIDPSCGAGSFLIAVADELVRRGVAPAAVLDFVRGMDIDAGAVAEARGVLGAWAEHHGLGPQGQRQAYDAISLGDHLDGWPTQWPDPAGVIGNPPFATPVRKGFFPPAAHAARRARAHWLGPYADLAALHFTLAYERSRAATVLCMVLPQSLLASRDTAGLRQELAQRAELVDVWASDETYFDAAVRVWAPIVIRRSSESKPNDSDQQHHEVQTHYEVAPHADLSLAERVAISLGAPRARLAAISPDMPARSAAASGPAVPSPTLRANIPSANIPRTNIPRAVTLGDIAVATAGFRDEYYRVVGACDEATPEEIAVIEHAWSTGGNDFNAELNGDLNADLTALPIVTSGSIDPLRSTWGRRPSRIAKRVWSHPVLRIDRLDDAGRQWLAQQRQPKVLLPTQSKMFEPFIDQRGMCIPVTPVISVFAPADSLSRIAAVLLAPAIVAHAYRRCYGLALSPNAIKVAARDLLGLPLPSHNDPWHLAATHIDAGLIGSDDDETGGIGSIAGLETIGRIMLEAYDLHGADATAATGEEIEAVWRWWYGRLGAVASLEA